MSYIKPAAKKRKRRRRRGVGNDNNSKTTDLCVPVWAGIILGGLAGYGVIKTLR
jgi:hypothetical protein